MKIPDDLAKALTEQILDLTPAKPPDASIEHILVEFDKTEPDHKRWLAMVADKLKTAKVFEIHCWEDEREWIQLALQYGEEKYTGWAHGKVITGKVTPDFCEMLLSQPKPLDTELYNKMTPFFNVFLDETFQSCHYGTENYL